MLHDKKTNKTRRVIKQNNSQHLNKNSYYTVKPVYKGHSREPENVPFMSSCPL